MRRVIINNWDMDSKEYITVTDSQYRLLWWLKNNNYLDDDIEIIDVDEHYREIE